jgi:hypothetical protein
MLNAGKIHGYNEIGNISNNPQPHKSWWKYKTKNEAYMDHWLFLMWD